MATNDKRLIVSEFDFDDVKTISKLFLKLKMNSQILILKALV